MGLGCPRPEEKTKREDPPGTQQQSFGATTSRRHWAGGDPTATHSSRSPLAAWQPPSLSRPLGDSHPGEASNHHVPWTRGRDPGSGSRVRPEHRGFTGMLWAENNQNVRRQPKGTEAQVSKQTRMFTAAGFTIAKGQKQPNVHPLMAGNPTWGRSLSCATARKTLETTTPREGSRSQEAARRAMPFIRNVSIRPIQKAECRIQGEAQGRGAGAYEGWGFLSGVRMFWNQTEVVGA